MRRRFQTGFFFGGFKTGGLQKNLNGSDTMPKERKQRFTGIVLGAFKKRMRKKKPKLGTRGKIDEGLRK